MTPTPKQLRQQLHHLLNQGCTHIASLFDPLSARMAGDLGFQCGVLGGSVAALQVLGAPDFNLITLSEFSEQARRITRVAAIPVLGDADNGYGNALNVMRSVQELEHAGLSGITLEDTLLPAAYGGPAPDAIPLQEAVDKLKAALQARQNPEFVLIARTNAGQQSDAETRERLQAYAATGVDGLCLVGVKSIEHLESLLPETQLPLMLVTYGNPELRDDHRLADLGVRLVLDGHAAYFAAIEATYNRFRTLQGLPEEDIPHPSDLARTYAHTDQYLKWSQTYLKITDL